MKINMMFALLCIYLLFVLDKVIVLFILRPVVNLCISCGWLKKYTRDIPRLFLESILILFQSYTAKVLVNWYILITP